jgi:hypothetical protein
MVGVDSANGGGSASTDLHRNLASVTKYHIAFNAMKVGRRGSGNERPCDLDTSKMMDGYTCARDAISSTKTA